jgi:hypothetical protein
LNKIAKVCVNRKWNSREHIIEPEKEPTLLNPDEEPYRDMETYRA